MKQVYESPKIIKSYLIELENEILKGSVVDDIGENTSVTTMGQEVVNIDASQFTSNWE